MADFTFTDGGGNSHTVPVWATEATLTRLVEALVGKQEKDTKKLTEQLKKLTEVKIPEIDEGIKDFDDQLQTNIETLKDFEQASGGFERFFEKTFGFFGNAIDKFIGLSLVALGTIAGTTIAKINQLGQTFNSLSQTGLALEGSTASTIGKFNQLGLSTEMASKFMLENAQAVRVLGSDVAPAVVNSFLRLSDQGNNLGLSLEDAIGFYADELALRTQLFNLGNLSVGQQVRMNMGIQKLATEQLAYSKALGVSTDAQREFTEATLGNNQMFMASTLRFSDSMNARVLPELQSFISGMRALGGEAGGEIAAAVTEAASMGAIGFSEAAFGFITVLPSLSDNMQDVILGFERGTLQGQEAVMAFTNELGNLSEAEKNRVFLLARAGDQNAAMMAKAIKQFEQASNQALEMEYSLENVQKGFNAFNTVMAKIRGVFSSFFNNFMDGFGQATGDTAELMTELGNNITNFLQMLFGTMFGVNTEGMRAVEAFKKIGYEVGVRFNKIIVKATSFIKGMVAGAEGLSFGEIIGNIGQAMVDGINNLIPWDKIAKAIGIGIIAVVGLALGKAVITGMVAGRAMAAGSVAGGAARTVGGGVGLGAAKAGKGIGMGARAMAGGLAALANPAALAGLAALTLAIIGIGAALRLAAPAIEAFGKAFKSVLEGLAPLVESFGNAIKSIFEGIASVINAVGESIAKVINAFRGDEVGKIKAEAEATKITTEATTAAIKELEGVDPLKMTGIADGIVSMADAFEVFSTQMTPGVIDSLKQGFAGLLGAQSPVQAIMMMSNNADPEKIMALAKATMAVNAANDGATTLDPSITNLNNNTYNSDSTNNTSNFTNQNVGGDIETATLRDVINNATSLGDTRALQTTTTNDLLRKLIKAVENMD